jgi:hypothetical protein
VVAVHDRREQALPREPVEDVSPNGTSGFGRSSVSGRRRVPKPAQSTMTLATAASFTLRP